MAMIDRNFTFATNGTVTANDLHNLIDSATIYQDLITGQQPITSVGTNYELLIADGTNPNAAPNAVTVYDLFEDALTAGTYTNANISAALTYGTATGTRLVSTNATITTGTITTGVIPTLTVGTTTSTAATITSGTVTNLASTTGTIATLNSTTGTIATLNSTTGTIGTINSTTGTIATLNSTTGTIGNLSTTLAGDFTITSGTGTLGTTGVTAGTYGTSTIIPVITVDTKGRVTSMGTSAVSAGKVLQVVSTTKTDVFSTTSTSFTDITGLSVSITPSSTSSKILVMCNVNGSVNSVSFQSGLRLVRDSTAIAIGDAASSRSRGFGQLSSANTWQMTFAGATFLDSPSSVASVTYKIQGLVQSTVTLFINQNSDNADDVQTLRGVSSITVMEIAG